MIFLDNLGDPSIYSLTIEWPLFPEINKENTQASNEHLSSRKINIRSVHLMHFVMMAIDIQQFEAEIISTFNKGSITDINEVTLL